MYACVCSEYYAVVYSDDIIMIDDWNGFYYLLEYKQLDEIMAS